MRIFIVIVVVYLLVLNVVTFVAYGIDKRRAKKNGWRIPEKSLLLMAAMGGAVGAALGMRCFRHKTQHKKFILLVPIFLLLHIAIIGYFAYWQWNTIVALF